MTAVEPAEAMRARVPALANLTMIATTWEDADVAPADLVLCAHVLYVVREVVPFLRKLEACARERVFVVLRDSPMDHPSSHLWKLLTGEERLRTPYLYDAYNLLHQMGVRPDVDMFSRPFELRFSSLEAAVEDGRLRLGAAWREEEGRQWLSENLEAGADGSAIWRGRDLSEGVLHWRPTPKA